MKLIICEKKSLAENVMKALNINSTTSKNGYCKNNEFTVTWCMGHLLSLYDLNDYDGFEHIEWRDVTDPFLPDFKYKIDTKRGDNVEKQFKIIENLIKENSYESIINCGDADREGQIIVDNILDYLNYTGKIERLWLPEQTTDTIKSQMNKLDDNSKYADLKREGLARTYLDWFLGINLTVHLSNVSRTKLNCGRLILPIVKFIYNREMEIKNFKPEKYYAIENKKNLPLILKTKFSLDKKEFALEKIKELNNNKAIVTNIEEKEFIKNPKKLFSLSTLQSYLSKNYNITFVDSMKVIQKLYEKGYITYPRTNTEYLANAEKEKIKKVIDKIISEYDINDIELKDTKSIFDDSKIESHSAITPTVDLPNINNFDGNEKIVYTVILNRFISNFLNEKCILIDKKMTVSVGNENFIIKGKAIKQLGYLKYEEEKFVDNIPNFNLNDKIDIEFQLIEKETTKPVKINETTLSNFLKNPLKKQKIDENIKEEKELAEEEEIENDDEDYKMLKAGIQIGTEATRTPAIEKCIKLEYISIKGANYSIEPKGIYFIELNNKLDIDLWIEKQIEYSQLLKQVYQNKLKADDMLLNMYEEIQYIFHKDIQVNPYVSNKEVIGKCLKCGSDMFSAKSKDGNEFYYCSHYKECNFKLWNTIKYYKDEIKINKVIAKKLLNGQTIKHKNIFDKEIRLELYINEWNGKEYPALREKNKDKSKK